MKEKLTAIVLSVVRHSDRADIVTLYTRERGRVSLVSRVGTSKAGRMRRSMLTPPVILYADAELDAGNALGRLGNIAPVTVLRQLRMNPMKSCVGIFIAEFLNKLLREMPPDAAMFDFIVDSLRGINDAQGAGAANAHIAMLIGLLRYCGISPDVSNVRNGSWFDMREGRFSELPPPHSDVVPPFEAGHIPVLMRMTMTNLRAYRLNGELRRHMLDVLLKYYAIHLPGTGNIKSKDILTVIFS